MEHRNHRLARRSLALAGSSAVMVGTVALGLALTGGSGPMRASLAVSAPTTTTTSAPTTTTTSAPTTTTTSAPTTTVQAQPGSPAATDPFSPASVCAAQPNFFTPAGRATIFHDFGGEVGPCLFFPAADAWVTPANGIPGFPAGDALLVDRCAAGDAACVSASSPHPLASFTAYPAPDPYAFQLQFEIPSSKPALGLLAIDDGRCGGEIFDVFTGQWYWGGDWHQLYAVPPQPPTVAPLTLPSYNLSSPPPPPSTTIPPNCDVQGPGIR
jgi:hypothetical protein